MRILFISTLFVYLTILGCAQKDSAVGSSLAPGLNDIYPLEKNFSAIAASFYQSQPTTGIAPYLYLGELDLGLQAHGVLRFSPASALPDSFHVDSLLVKLYLDSVITETGNELSLEALLVNRSQEWNEVGVSWDNLDSLQLGGSIAQFNAPAVPADSDSVVFALPAPDSLLHAWVAAGEGGKTLHYNNGLYLRPVSGSNQMARFSSRDYSTLVRRPKLEMHVTLFDASDTTGYYPVDTVLYTYAIADAYLANDAGSLDSTYLYLATGVTYWSLLQFDLSEFPAFGVGLQRAELILHADTAHALNFSALGAAYTLAMEDTSWYQDPVNAPIAFGTAQGALGYYDQDAATLTLKLNTMTANWISHPEENAGFLILTSNANYRLARTVFYGLTAPDSLRPRLHVIYLEGQP